MIIIIIRDYMGGIPKTMRHFANQYLGHGKVPMFLGSAKLILSAKEEKGKISLFSRTGSPLPQSQSQNSCR